MSDRFAPYREVAPRVDSFVRALGRALAPERVLSSETELRAYRYDASMETGAPIAVCFPGTAEEVARLFALCREQGVALVPRGSGTNLSGGTTAPHGGVVCHMSRFCRIVTLEPEERTAVAEAYVYNDDINAAGRPHGLHFAPDPSSYRVSTLGGNAAENSGGPHALKYGVTTQHILGLEAVLPGGESVSFGGRALERSGSDLLALLVGSEGTLGVITRLTLRLTPLPESVRTLLAIFDAESRAGEAVSAVIASGIVPSTLEMLDRETIRAVEASMPAGYPSDADAVLLIELDGIAEAVEHEATVVERVCRECGARSVEVTSDPVERERLWHGRRSGYAALARVATGLMVCDSVVPRDVIAEALRRNRAIAERFGLRMADTFHAGDGNLHPKLIFEASDPGQVRQVRLASDEMMRGAIDLGGAVTGEHGVGTEKIHAMPWSLDAATLRLNRGVKLLFDPEERANPGKLLEAADVPLPSPVPVRCEGLEEALSRAAPDAVAPGRSEDAADGLLPAWVVRPGSSEELAAVLAAAHAVRTRVIGAGSSLDWGRPLEGLDVLVQTDRANAVREMRPQNLSATFEAGVTWHEAAVQLAEHGLGLRFHPGHRPLATLGGIVASASSGPTRTGYGPLRDALLGLGAALVDGSLASLGGRVMKNVAGYDLARSLVGARGAGAALAYLTLRLVPLAETVASVARACPSLEEAVELALEVRRRVREPLVLRATGSVRGANLTIAFAGPRAATERLTAECVGVVGDCDTRVSDGRAPETWTALGDPFSEALAGAPGAAEVSLPAGREPSFLRAVSELLGDAAVDVGAGWLGMTVPTVSAEALDQVDLEARRRGGWALDVRGPREMREAYYLARPETRLEAGLARVYRSV